MSVSRNRLQDIAELAREMSNKQWGRKSAVLAHWIKELAQAVHGLDEGQEQHEAEIGALSDAVDEIDSLIDGIAGEQPDPFYPEYNDYSDDETESDGVVDLTTVPYVVDDDLALNEAYMQFGKLHVGAEFAEMLKAAAEVAKEFNIGDRVYLCRPDPKFGRYCIPDVSFFEHGTIIGGPDGYGDFTVKFERINHVHAVKPTMIDPAKAAA